MRRTRKTFRYDQDCQNIEMINMSEFVNSLSILKSLCLLLYLNFKFFNNDQINLSIVSKKSILWIKCRINENHEWTKLTLTTASTLKVLDYSLTTEEIILAIDASLREWKTILMQIFQKRQHSCRYESELWNEVERNYDVEKKNVEICWKH